MQGWKPLALVTIIIGFIQLASLNIKADETKLPTPDRTQIEQIVRDFLISNPEVIEEAMNVLTKKREEHKNLQKKTALVKFKSFIKSHPMTPVSGNPRGDITVVEFFDYQCGYCKRSLSTMLHLLKTDKNVRVVWKEMPILGPVSRLAAQAAMASIKQNKYFEFHVQMMESRGRLSESKIVEIARSVGINVKRLKIDMKDPGIEAYLNETLQLAKALGIQGTPAFVIEDTVVGGAIDQNGIKRIIAEFRGR